MAKNKLNIGPGITLVPRMTVATNAVGQGVDSIHVSRLRPVDITSPKWEEFKAAVIFLEANEVQVVGYFKSEAFIYSDF